MKCPMSIRPYVYTQFLGAWNRKSPGANFFFRDIILDFEWRRVGDYEHQLVTWSRDQSLRIWSISQEMQYRYVRVSAGHLVQGTESQDMVHQPGDAVQVKLKQSSTHRSHFTILLINNWAKAVLLYFIHLFIWQLQVQQPWFSSYPCHLTITKDMILILPMSSCNFKRHDSHLTHVIL